MNFNDFMNSSLIKRGYSNITEVPKEEIVSTMELFFCQKLNKMEIREDICELFNEYAKTVKNKETDLAMIIHYILGYISILEHFHVTWQIEEVEEPVITYSEIYPNLIDSLKTSKEIDYEKVFELVFYTALDLKERKEEGLNR